MRTSYSAIETYLQCPQRYKFQEIDKIKVPKSREALFGTIVHDTLHYMFKRDPLFPTLDEVIAYFRSHWPSREVFEKEAAHDPLKRVWTEDEEKLYFQEGLRMLKKFYEKNAPWNFTVVDLESRFEVVVTDDKTGQSHILAGVIDRIDKHADDSYEIIDYKTSRRMPSQESLQTNVQLSFYALGIQKRWPHLNPEEIALSLYFLKHGEKLTTKATKEITAKATDHVVKTINDIQERIASGKPFEPMPGPLCNWCGYRPLCPAWKHLYRGKGEGERVKGEEIDAIIKDYFAMKKVVEETKTKLDELQKKIKDYMAAEGLTRVFGDEGYIATKTVQRYGYDWQKIKELLSPLGRWEDVLKTDDTKLKRLLKELPPHIRATIEETRSVAKEYSTFTASLKKIEEELEIGGSRDAV